LGNKNAIELLVESDYLEHANEINEETIYNQLCIYKKLVNECCNGLMIKELAVGFFLRNNEQDAVGYYPFSEDLKERIFSDGKIACAFFIKRGIEDIAKYVK
jgi:hypothetical protein